ncbi:MAG TPA: hypothetical protein VMW50_03770 [Dehalococcoidia bacterium]|nr:hypothetical protein [Dehalococcoidia bacterium]
MAGHRSPPKSSTGNNVLDLSGEGITVANWSLNFSKDLATVMSFTPSQKYHRLVALRHDDKRFLGRLSQAPPQSAITNLGQTNNVWPSICVPIAEPSCSPPVAGSTKGTHPLRDEPSFIQIFSPSFINERGKKLSVVLWTKISKKCWIEFKSSAVLADFTYLQHTAKRGIDTDLVFHILTGQEHIR